MMGNDQREDLQNNIVERLDSYDEASLIRIGDMLDSVEEDSEKEAVLFSEGVTRRQFFAGVAAGGATLVATNLATGLAAGSLGMKAGQTAAGLENEVELVKLRGLLALHENLEQVGIDTLLSTGIAALSVSIDGLEMGITGLQKGVSLVNAGLSAVENAFPAIRRGLTTIERLVESLEDRVRQLQELMSEVQEMASPLSDAVGGLLSSLVERIPGVGPAIVDALDRISDLVGSLPDAIGELRSGLLEPLREDWFTDDEESGLKGRLLNPLQEDLLEPLEEFLSGLVNSVDAWQQQLIDPAERALTEREMIREQIADYKEREGIA